MNFHYDILCDQNLPEILEVHIVAIVPPCSQNLFAVELNKQMKKIGESLKIFLKYSFQKNCHDYCYSTFLVVEAYFARCCSLPFALQPIADWEHYSPAACWSGRIRLLFEACPNWIGLLLTDSCYDKVQIFFDCMNKNIGSLHLTYFFRKKVEPWTVVILFHRSTMAFVMTVCGRNYNLLRLVTFIRVQRSRRYRQIGTKISEKAKEILYFEGGSFFN